VISFTSGIFGAAQNPQTTLSKRMLDTRSILDCFQWFFSVCAVVCYMKRIL